MSKTKASWTILRFAAKSNNPSKQMVIEFLNTNVENFRPEGSRPKNELPGDRLSSQPGGLPSIAFGNPGAEDHHAN